MSDICEPAQSWGDVYYFCGEDMRFCTCEFKWNLAGWGKALTLWNFVLSSALGLQKLAIRVGMDGLLPGAKVRPSAASEAVSAFVMKGFSLQIVCIHPFV